MYGAEPRKIMDCRAAFIARLYW